MIGRFYGNKILYKNRSLFKGEMLPKIFRWPEMCPLGKILAQDFQMAAFTKISGRRDTSIAPLVSIGNRKTLNKNAHSMYGGDCDAAIAKAAAAMTHVQS